MLLLCCLKSTFYGVFLFALGVLFFQKYGSIQKVAGYIMLCFNF